MISVDTETNSLWFKHGAQTFAIGAYDGVSCLTETIPVNPRTRKREHSSWKQEWRSIILSHDVIVMHNAQFDVDALHEAGVFTEEDLDSALFWDKIIDNTHLAHLFNSKDKRSLKYLNDKYLDAPYTEVDELDRLVTRCRNYVSSRHPDWLTAKDQHRYACPSLFPASSGQRWVKMDMWLPEAVILNTNQADAKNYFGEDYVKLPSVLEQYLAKDCIATFDLASGFMYELGRTHGKDAERLLNVNHQIQPAISRMQRRGVHLNTDTLKAATDLCRRQASNHLSTLRSMVGGRTDKSFTDREVRDLLYERWKLPVTLRTDSGLPSASTKHIVRLRSNTPKGSVPWLWMGRYIAYKKYLKKVQAFEGYARKEIDGVMYPSYNSTGTDTVRFSSKDPNGQNIEKASDPFKDDPDITALLEQAPNARSVFGPAPGRIWVCMDYSQLQLRIFAVAINDENMIEAFRNGWDGHDYTTHKIFDLPEGSTATEAQRRIGKNTNFGFIFGASPRKIEQTAGVPGLWDTVTSMFPLAHEYIESTKQRIESEGYVETLGGYRLHIPEYYNERWGRWEKKAHAGVNYIVQGTEGEIVKRALLYVDDYLYNHTRIDGFVTLQVHDEFVFDLPADCPALVILHLKNLMEKAALEYGVEAPVDADLVHQSWKQKQPIQIPSNLTPQVLKRKTIWNWCTT